MIDKKERRPIKSDILLMTPIEAIYILALGAARSDGDVDEAEALGLKAIAALQGHEKHLEYASAYYAALKDNENAIDGALKVVSDGGEAYKMTALVFMKYILEKSGESEEESAFFSKALNSLR